MTVGAAVLLALIVVVAASDENNAAEPSVASSLVGTGLISRAKRQTYYYYLCGTYPNQYYQYYPCNSCSNGGVKLGYGCTAASQCVNYATYPTVVTCLNNCCCTVPTQFPPTAAPTTTVVLPANAMCWTGQLPSRSCSGNTCPNSQACVNGLCCPQSLAWQYACGGEAATAACINGVCGSGFSCTTSQYCCECPVGRANGQAVNGVCPIGFTRNAANNFCCATCPSGQSPLGACVNGGCGNGYACSPGNICCRPVG